ncbi:MAG: D-glycero-beta-D-manno-heptose 1-phosphate adenylyltransferase [Candidatus Delongbacteria bacterium]|nr:D-glycero-beta-D-manno-heptose 1-phosphate adenylyltransferase [Candidatus Delongbacteria bacterium]
MNIEAEELRDLVRNLRSEGKTVIFTNGVFDVLHRGHAEYLNKSKALGDILIVGVNDDDSVRRLKGPERPVNCLDDRIYVLNSLRSVDHTVVFGNDTPFELIRLIMPDVLVKGGDYDPEMNDSSDSRYIVGSDIVKRAGGKVTVIELVEGRSSTNTINKLKEIK